MRLPLLTLAFLLGATGTLVLCVGGVIGGPLVVAASGLARLAK